MSAPLFPLVATTLWVLPIEQLLASDSCQCVVEQVTDDLATAS